MHLDRAKAKNAVFIMTHDESLLSPQLIELSKDRSTNYDVYLIINGKGNSENAKIFISNDEIFSINHNKNMEKRIIPGNADLLLIEAFKKANKYEQYIIVEYDVFYNGEISTLINHIFDKYKSFDFASPFIRSYVGNEKWMWWPSLRTAGERISDQEKHYAFLQFALYSNQALIALQRAVADGWTGHHEVLHATLFYTRCLKVQAFTQDSIIRFDAMTFRAIPPRLIKGEGYLHHPIKKSDIAHLEQQIAISATMDIIEARRISARALLGEINRLVLLQSLIDVGCGLGIWLEAAEKIGIQKIQGIDGPWTAQLPFLVNKEKLTFCDIRNEIPLDIRFDVCLCIEVAHQLEESAADGLVDKLISLSECVVFSAAIPGQGGFKQLNEQWPSYWSKKFQQKGYVLSDIRSIIWNNKHIHWWIRQNLLVFTSITFAELHPKLSEIKSTGPLNIVHPELFYEKVSRK